MMQTYNSPQSFDSPKRKTAKIAWKNNDEDHPIFTYTPMSTACMPASVQGDMPCDLPDRNTATQVLATKDKIKINLMKTTSDTNLNLLKALHEKRSCVPEFTGKKKFDGSVDVLFDCFEKANSAKKYFDEHFADFTVSDPTPSKFEKFNLVGLGFEMTISEVIESMIDENKRWLDLIKISDNVLQLKSDAFSVMQIHKVSKCKSGIFKVMVSMSSNMVATLGSKKLSIGYVLCKSYKLYNHRRCFHCQQHGHVAAKCTNEKACSKCGLNHSYLECHSNFSKCVNCTINGKAETDHPSYSPNCPCNE